MVSEFQKPNSMAIAGFLVPFVAAGLTGLILLASGHGLGPAVLSILYLTVVPLTLLAGLFLSIRSIPLIEKLGDKDYAYCGLVLNILFLLVYLTSLIYFSYHPLTG